MTRGNILFVDDNPDWRDLIAGLLIDNSYTVNVATNQFEALQRLHEQPYHIALIDLRLDERNEQNQEGLALAESMKEYMPELEVIIYTAYPTIDAATQALSPKENGNKPTAFYFITKNAKSQELLHKIDSTLANGAKINPELAVILQHPLTWDRLQQSLDCLKHLPLTSACAEITDVLQKIFYTSQTIRVRSLPGGHSTAAVLLAEVTNADGVTEIDQVVKLNQYQRAQQEAQNYNQYVRNRLGGARSTRLMAFRRTGILGGLAYSLVGAKATNFQLFKELYQTASIQQIYAVLNNLFKETCYYWYKDLQPLKQRESLSAAYKEWLRLDQNKLQQNIEELINHSENNLVTFVEAIAPHQPSIKLVQDEVRLAPPLRALNLPLSYYGVYCVTHGDLNEGNILIDQYEQTWLIDFYKTGLGHPARDFAMLESVVKHTLQQSGVSLLNLYRWENALLQTPSLLSEPDFPATLPLDAELEKATCVVLHIRRLLRELLPDITLQDYHIALYFHALKEITLVKKFTVQQRFHALLCSAILAELIQ